MELRDLLIAFYGVDIFHFLWKIHKYSHINGKQKVALVDIDETICFYPGTRRYDLSEPNQENPPNPQIPIGIVWKRVERVMGIEPTSQAWEAHVLPLYDTRI